MCLDRQIGYLGAGSGIKIYKIGFELCQPHRDG